MKKLVAARPLRSSKPLRMRTEPYGSTAMKYHRCLFSLQFRLIQDDSSTELRFCCVFLGIPGSGWLMILLEGKTLAPSLAPLSVCASAHTLAAVRRARLSPVLLVPPSPPQLMCAECPGGNVRNTAKCNTFMNSLLIHDYTYYYYL